MTADRRALARSAYERARWLRALPDAVPAVVLGLVGWAVGSTTALPGALVLVVLAVAARWRGGDVGRGARAGTWAGGLAAVVVLASQCTGHCDPERCLWICGGAGLLGALALLPAARGASAAWFAAALATASAAALVPCAPMGLAGFAVVPALVAGAVPLVVGRRLSGA